MSDKGRQGLTVGDAIVLVANYVFAVWMIERGADVLQWLWGW